MRLYSQPLVKFTNPVSPVSTDAISGELAASRHALDTFRM